MKKGGFDLTGKAIDCSGLQDLGDAGKKIFRALKVACNGVDDNQWSIFSDLGEELNRFLLIDPDDGAFALSCDDGFFSLEVIKPSDVLGQAAIDAAMDGATIVFDGDIIPEGRVEMHFNRGGKIESFGSSFIVTNRSRVRVVAYKSLEEKPRHRTQAQFESKVLTEKVNASDVLSSGAKHLSDRASTYDSPEGERSMGSTVEAFESITGHSLTEEQGWLFMALLKAVRSQQGNYKLDNYEDGAAYFALMAEAASQSRNKGK